MSLYNTAAASFPKKWYLLKTVLSGNERFFWQLKIGFSCVIASLFKELSNHCCAVPIHRNTFPLRLSYSFPPYTVAPSAVEWNKHDDCQDYTWKPHVYYYGCLKNVPLCSSFMVCIVFLLMRVCVYMLLQNGVQQGGSGPTSWQRLQVLQQWCAGWHGSRNVPQCSRTSCHTQSSLPSGCIHTPLTHLLCVSPSFSANAFLWLCKQSSFKISSAPAQSLGKFYREIQDAF